jgi:Na+-driven multidrug efflux pump
MLTLFDLTWPIFVELALHMLMGIVDTFMLGRYDDKAVAAVGVVNQLSITMNLLFTFVAAGTMILIACKIGAGDRICKAEEPRHDTASHVCHHRNERNLYCW